MANDIVDLSRLKATLQTSGLSQKNQALHQVIWSLIDFCQKSLNNLSVSASSGGSSPAVPSGGKIIGGGIPILGLDGCCDEEPLIIIPGPSIYNPAAFSIGSVLFVGPTGKITQNNARFFWNNTTDRLALGHDSPQDRLDVRGDGTDIGYLARFQESNFAGSTYIQLITPSGNANAQAGFTLFQIQNSAEWRFAIVGNENNAFRVSGGVGVNTTRLYVTVNSNLIINDSLVDSTTGTKCLIIGDGTAPTSLSSNTAAFFANDVGGTVQLFAINEALRVRQLTDVSNGLTTSTGTVNDLDVAGAEIFYLDNATDITITGIVAGYNGQRVTFISRAAGNCYFTHQDAGSTAANRLVNTVTSGPTPIAANKGNATYEYDTSISRWRLIGHEQGTYIAFTFSAGDYTGNGAMTWTVAAGDVTTYRYLISGKTIFVILTLVTTTVGGVVNTQLLLTIPGYTIAGGSRSTCYILDNGVVSSARVFFSGGGTQLVFQRFDGANWTAAADNTALEGSFFGELA